MFFCLRTDVGVQLNLKEMSVKEGLEAIAFIIRLVREEARDKPYVFEARYDLASAASPLFTLLCSWISEETGWKHEMVPLKLREAADKVAMERKKQLDEGEDDMDE